MHSRVRIKEMRAGFFFFLAAHERRLPNKPPSHLIAQVHSLFEHLCRFVGKKKEKKPKRTTQGDGGWKERKKENRHAKKTWDEERVPISP